MANIIPVPTLGTLGFITDPINKFDHLISHFFLSDYNQTYLYKDHVTSLPRIIEKNGNNMTSVVAELKSSLEVYLGRYYNTVLVNVNLDNTDDLTSSATISISVGVTENGTQNTFGKLLETVNGKIAKISTLNNY